MANILLLVVCLIAGVIFRKSKLLPENSHIILNYIVIYICLPALALLYIPELKVSTKIIFPITSAWIVFGFSVLFFYFLGKILKLDKYTVGSLTITGGLCNTAFIGYPVLLALFGEEGLKVGVVVDQTGSFVILSTVGIVVASYYSRGKIEHKNILKKIISYPSFIAFIIGVIMNIFDLHFQGEIASLLTKIGGPLPFLALMSVGLQLRVSLKHLPVKELSFGLLYKLILAPLIVYIIFFIIFNEKGIDVQCSLLQASMSPMIMGAILASDFNLNPKLANLMVGIGIPLSFFTIVLWYFIIK